MMKPFLACMLGLALAGCDGGGGGDPVPADQIGEEFGPVICEKLFECCTAAELMDEALGAETVEECSALFGGFIDTLLEPVIQDSIDAGRLVYDADALGGCVEAYTTLTCAELAGLEGNDTPFGDCANPFDPQVASGGECANDLDCISAYCAGDSVDFETGVITYGTCTDAPSPGDPCDDFECGDGAFCDTAGAEPTCEAKLSNGSACTADSECDSDFCSDANQCAENMTCDGV